MRGDMPRILASLALFFFLVPVTFVRGPEPTGNTSQDITLEPIVLDSEDPARTKLGQLEFLGGWRMTSDHHQFGGISAMLVMDGNRFFMLSDAGVLIGFTLNEQDNVAERLFIAPLPDGPAKPNEFARKIWDSESLVHDPETGQFWVGFEDQHSIWRYGPSFARKEAKRDLAITKKWPANGGSEAMLRIPGDATKDTQFLIFSETAPYRKGGTQALIAMADPAEATTTFKRFGYQAPAGYRITDAALLPDGRALILNRRFTPLDGISAIVSIADPTKIKPGTVWDATPIVRLKSPIRVDNMEALAVTTEGEDIIVWIASDDNFSVVQETLLMKFRLLRGKAKRRSSSPEPENEKAEESPGFSSLE